MKESLAHSSVVSQNKKVAMQRLQNHNGYFQTFEWMEDQYNNEKEAQQFDLIY